MIDQLSFAFDTTVQAAPVPVPGPCVAYADDFTDDMAQALAWGNEALARIDHGLVSVHFQWSRRARSSLGIASMDGPGHGVVRLSAPLWPRAPAAERRDTVLHELAHILVSRRWQLRLYPSRPAGHGPEWRDVMRNEMGIANPQRCHDLDNSDLQLPGHNAWCACTMWRLSATGYRRWRLHGGLFCDHECKGRLYTTPREGVDYEQTEALRKERKRAAAYAAKRSKVRRSKPPHSVF